MSAFHDLQFLIFVYFHPNYSKIEMKVHIYKCHIFDQLLTSCLFGKYFPQLSQMTEKDIGIFQITI